MDAYGSDFITISDDDGKDYELEVLSTLEYNGETYLAVVPAEESQDELELEVSILKSVMDGDEPVLVAVEDDAELEAVYDLLMQTMFEDDEAEDSSES